MAQKNKVLGKGPKTDPMNISRDGLNYLLPKPGFDIKYTLINLFYVVANKHVM